MKTILNMFCHPDNSWSNPRIIDKENLICIGGDFIELDYYHLHIGIITMEIDEYVEDEIMDDFKSNIFYICCLPYEI